MLQSMRQLAKSWVFKGLMLLLVVSFGIWGVGDMFRDNPQQRTVAKVGGETITVQELRDEFDRNLAQVRGRLGPDFTAQQAKDMGLLSITLNSMIARLQVAQQAHAFGIDISPKTMLEVFSAVPEFQDKNGKFSKELMRERLGGQNLNERRFVERQREEMARHQLIDVFAAKDPLPADVIDMMYKARGQKRVFDILTLADNSVADKAAPDDKTLRDFYEKNAAKFTAPEYRSITVARLSTDDLAKDMTIGDDQLKKEYETQSANLDRPEQREILQTVLQDEPKAAHLAAQAQASGNLAVAAKSEGYDVISLGETDKNSVLPGLAAKAFAMKEGEISGPIKTSLGWHVIQIKKIIPAGKPSFAAMKDALSASLRHDQAVEAATKIVNQMDDELAGGHALEDIADGLKLRVIKVPAVDATGKTPDGKDPAELPFKAEILKAAFGQNSGDTSPILDDKNGNYYVVRTDDVTPSAVKPFDKIKADVTAAWKTQQQATLAKVEAAAIAQDLRSGKTAASFAARDGVTVRLSKPVSDLGDTDPALPDDLLPEMLQMKKGEVMSWPQPGHQLIVRLASVTAADEKDSAAGKGQITGEMNEDAPKELSSEYIKYLRQTFPVTIHQDVLDMVVQQGG